MEFYRRADVVFVLWRDDIGFWVSREGPDGSHIDSKPLARFLVEGDKHVVVALEDFIEAAMANYEPQRRS